MDPLLASLLDLMRELEPQGIPLTIGGGFGLYLKRTHMERMSEQTLFQELSVIRSTNDIDVFLHAELLADFDRASAVAGIIRKLGYVPVEEAKFLQWKRSIDVAGVKQEVKIDMLVGPLGLHREKLKVNRPRARPKGELQFHAHMVEEALHIEANPIPVRVEGKGLDGQPYDGIVFVPEAYSYLLMKLHAFEDRKGDASKDSGRHHALDIYTTVGLMTRMEYERAKELAVTDQDNEHLRRARAIVNEEFSGASALGVLRLKEHPLFRADFRIEEFVAVLEEIFG